MILSFIRVNSPYILAGGRERDTASFTEDFKMYPLIL